MVQVSHLYILWQASQGKSLVIVFEYEIRHAPIAQFFQIYDLKTCFFIPLGAISEAIKDANFKFKKTIRKNNTVCVTELLARGSFYFSR